MSNVTISAALPASLPVIVARAGGLLFLVRSFLRRGSIKIYLANGLTGLCYLRSL